MSKKFALLSALVLSVGVSPFVVDSANAETTPTPIPTATMSKRAEPISAFTDAAPTATPTPTATATTADRTITLSPLTCIGKCGLNNTLWAGYGSTTFSGSTNYPAGTVLKVARIRANRTTYESSGTVTVGTGGKFRVTRDQNHAGNLRYRVTSPDGKVIVYTNLVKVGTPAISMNSGITGDTMIGSKFSGRLNTGTAGQVVKLSIWKYFPAEKRSRWSGWKSVTTTTNGNFSGTFTYDKGFVGTQKWKADVVYPNTGGTYSKTFSVAKTASMRPRISNVTASMVPVTYHAGCPVGPSSLRRITMNYWGFDGRIHEGYIIVRSGTTVQFQNVFQAAFNAKFPMRIMKDPSPYRNDDNSMAADNTYAFFCRQVNGNPYVMSPHSYGKSVDINPVENPYRKPNGVWYPVNGRTYVDRSNVRPGMLFSSSPMTKAFFANNFKWLSGFDWQHFQIR